MSHLSKAVHPGTGPAIGRRTFMGAAAALAFVAAGGTGAHAATQSTRKAPDTKAPRTAVV